MNEIQNMEYEEAIAYMDYLMETLADIYLCEATPSAIDRATYKASGGVGVVFDEEGIVVTGIVKGFDAEFSARVELSDDPETLKRNFLGKVKEICDMVSSYLERTMGEIVTINVATGPYSGFRLEDDCILAAIEYIEISPVRSDELIHDAIGGLNVRYTLGLIDHEAWSLLCDTLMDWSNLMRMKAHGRDV